MEEYTQQEILAATELIPTLWILQNNICNENGTPIEFHNHRFLWDIYNDLSQFQVLLKPPQIGATVMNTIKCFFIAKKLGKQIIYTLPTQGDIQAMVGGSINRIIAQNPILMDWVHEHDTVEQKTVGNSMIFYRGTWTAKAAMMIPSNLNVHDETDSSNQQVIQNYETRLQADPNGMRWYFSHPSLPDYGVDKYWKLSDQKHWFITCPSCEASQYLSWPESIDPIRVCYQCKECKVELTDDDRRNGQWFAKYKDKQFSGYWISQLMCPWITAEKICQDFKEKSPEYFWNYVLGLPYAGGDAKLTENHLFQNLTHNVDVALNDERVVIGIDTGLRIDYVLGNQRLGLFHHGDSNDYRELNGFMQRWKNAVAVIDGGGDYIGAQKFAEQWQGRVFKAYAGEDRKTNQLFRWGERKEQGQVLYDLNRTWQLLVDEFRDKRIPLQGDENDWYEYWLDWKNMSRIKVIDPVTNQFKGIKWVRNGRNHRASATLFWRIGMDKFSGGHATFLSARDPANAVAKGFEA